MTDPVKDIDEELKGEAPAFIAMMTSKGYDLWDKYAATMEAAYKESILYAKTFEEWQEAKSNFDAVQRARRLPQILLERIMNMTSETELTETP